MLGSWGEPCLAEYLVSKAKTLQEGKGGGCRTSSSQEALVVTERRMHGAE